MAFDVVVLGSLHMDIVVSAPDRPRRGETLAGHGWSLKPGGKGGNQAVAAAGAGARTAMIGAVGDDEFGQPLLENLQAIGVDASHVAVRRDAGSGMSVAIVDAGGDYGAVIVSGVNLLLGGAEVDAADRLFDEAGWLVLQNEVPDAANLAAAAKARQHGVSTILNAAPARPFPAGLNGLIDVLVVNEIEAEAMAATAVDSLATATDAAKRLLDFADAVIVTAGAAGASLARRNGRTAEIAGHQVRLVSTHGAGDCFVGVLAARLSRGDELEQAARYANAAAALRVASPPGPPRAIDPAAIRNLLESGNTDSIR
jgi:ribokinase